PRPRSARRVRYRAPGSFRRPQLRDRSLRCGESYADHLGCSWRSTLLEVEKTAWLYGGCKTRDPASRERGQSEWEGLYQGQADTVVAFYPVKHSRSWKNLADVPVRLNRTVESMTRRLAPTIAHKCLVHAGQ